MRAIWSGPEARDADLAGIRREPFQPYTEARLALTGQPAPQQATSITTSHCNTTRDKAPRFLVARGKRGICVGLRELMIHPRIRVLAQHLPRQIRGRPVLIARSRFPHESGVSPGPTQVAPVSIDLLDRPASLPRLHLNEMVSAVRALVERNDASATAPVVTALPTIGDVRRS